MSNGVSVAATAPPQGWAWPARFFYEALLAAHWAIVRPLRFRSRGVLAKGPKRILLSGTFFSENWVLNHLKPLAASAQCERVLLVTTFPVPSLANVEAISPPLWAIRAFGEVPARLLTFVLVAFRQRPDAVGGFHILPNALVALLIARLIGRRSIYFCGGGPAELEGGGFYSGARSAALLRAPDAGLEKRLMRAVNEMDLVVTMGPGAGDFFRNRGVQSRIEVVPGGIDPTQFQSHPREEAYDLILVARLDPVKRIDLFLKTVQQLMVHRTGVSAVIVGGGELDGPLKKLAQELGVGDRVTFTGHQADVGLWLARARVFVLTSQSEGLSLALMEAMTNGLPCVVSNVGELGQLVSHGTTGFLVDDHSPDEFAKAIEQLLADQSLRARFAEAGRLAASRLTVAETSKRWDGVLAAL